MTWLQLKSTALFECSNLIICNKSFFPFHRQIQHHFINDEGARSPTDVLPAEVP